MEHIIDVGLVKQQLRLLGHSVGDDVILAFVKGLNKESVHTAGARGGGTRTRHLLLLPHHQDTRSGAHARCRCQQPQPLISVSRRGGPLLRQGRGAAGSRQQQGAVTAAEPRCPACCCQGIGCISSSC
jgi:hypothetical protein